MTRLLAPSSAMPNLISGPVTSKSLTVTLSALISMAATRSEPEFTPTILAAHFCFDTRVMPVFARGIYTFWRYVPGSTQMVWPVLAADMIEFILSVLVTVR